MSEFNVYTVPNDGFKKKMPAWQRSVLVHDDGTIFVPACLGASETEVMLCAGYDGIGIAQHKGHLFVPIDWLEKEFSCQVLSEVCDKIRRSMESWVDWKARQ